MQTRNRLEQFLEDEQAAGLNPKEAREKIVREAAFTWLNRLVAFKMMESRKLLRQTISKGPQSNGFLMWLTEPGNERVDVFISLVAVTVVVGDAYSTLSPCCVHT